MLCVLRVLETARMGPATSPLGAPIFTEGLFLLLPLTCLSQGSRVEGRLTRGLMSHLMAVV